MKTTEGHVDLLTDLSPTETLRVARSPLAKVVKGRRNVRAVIGMFNTDKVNSPWRDVRLRRAVNYAINRAHVMRYAAKGNGTLLPAFLAPGAFGYDPDLQPYPYDPDQTRQLLNEAGYPNGLSLNLIVDEELKTQGTVVSKMLENAGFDVHFLVMSRTAMMKQVFRYWLFNPFYQAKHRRYRPMPTWDIALQTTFAEYDTYSPLISYRIYLLDGGGDWMREVPECRALYRQLLRTRDRDQQQKLIRQMERHIQEQAYFVSLYAPFQLFAVSQAVEFQAHPTGFLYLGDTQLAPTEQHWSVRDNKMSKPKSIRWAP